MSIRDNRVPVALAQHAHNVLRAIDDDREQIHDVAAKYTHVERGRISKSGEVAVELNPLPRFALYSQRQWS